MLTIEASEAREVDKWQHTRYLAYLTYCTVTDQHKRKEITDFLPLPGDPVAENKEQRRVILSPQMEAIRLQEIERQRRKKL